jgi:superoxide dismutase, Cu-Zn family
MSWGRYSGELTDFATTKPDVFKGARASAIMIGMDGTSLFRLRVSGIDAKDGAYGVHLHQGKCVAEDWSAAGPPYNVTWLDLDVDSQGNARSTATVSFIPEGQRSIVLHGLPTDPQTGIAGPRLACLPLDIKQIG